MPSLKKRGKGRFRFQDTARSKFSELLLIDWESALWLQKIITRVNFNQRPNRDS